MRFLSRRTLEFHYGKHHATYTATLNKLLEEAGAAGKFSTIEELLAGLSQIDEAKRTAIRNNAGGYYNHNLYFTTMAPLSENVHEPAGALAEQINKQFACPDAHAEQKCGDDLLP